MILPIVYPTQNSLINSTEVTTYVVRMSFQLEGGGDETAPIRILACHLTYHLNPIWHDILQDTWIMLRSQARKEPHHFDGVGAMGPRLRSEINM
jgi:hypothetical protein